MTIREWLALRENPKIIKVVIRNKYKSIIYHGSVNHIPKQLYDEEIHKARIDLKEPLLMDVRLRDRV